MAPPEEMLAAPAFPCADAAAARQEVADELLLQRSPYIRWVYLVALAVMVLGLLVEVVVWGVTGEAEIEGLVVSLALSLFFLSRFLHPGAPMRKWVRYQFVSEAHIHQGKVLVHTPGVAWSMLPVSLVNGARTMNHAYVYTVRGGGVLGISRTVPPPADLPRPAPVKWWRNAMLLAVASFVAPALCLGLWYYCVPQSDSEAVDEVSERGDALAAYVQDLLPPGEFPGGISWCGVYGMEEGGSAVIIVWDSGLELTMEIPPVADASEADADSQL